jgi:hypothetical protein
MQRASVLRLEDVARATRTDDLAQLLRKIMRKIDKPDAVVGFWTERLAIPERLFDVGSARLSGFEQRLWG